MKKRRKRQTSVRERFAARSAARARREDELIALAAETVPPGSGHVEFGSGRHCYVKANNVDGSTRCFSFRTLEAAERAMAAGVAADTPVPGWNHGLC